MLPTQRPRAGEQLVGRVHDVLGLGHPADPELTFRRLALVGADENDPAGAQGLRVRAGRRVHPHARIHRGGHERRPPVCERRLRQHVVGEPVRELCERVGGAGCDDQQVGASQVEVDVVRGGTARERSKRLGGDEALSARRDQRDHVVTALDEQAADLACLVGGDASRHPEQDAGHGQIMPGDRRYVTLAAP